MIHLQIKLDENDPLFILLIWNGSVWKKLYKFLFFRKLKPLFSATSFNELEELFLEIEEKVAKSFAISCLSKKALLSSELCKKMEEKGISCESIAKTLVFCQKIGALPDFQTLENRIEKELRKGRGLMYAKAKWQRSVHEEPIDWNSSEKRNLEKQAALTLIKKQKKDKKDLFLFLLRKGFRSE